MTISYGMADFKAKCLQIVAEVAASGQSVDLTKRGTPLARIVPVEVREQAPIYGMLQGTARWTDDLLDTGESWDAERPAD